MKSVMLAAVLLSAATHAYAAPSLRLDKTEYAPGEPVTVRFDTGGAAVQENGWVGIVPSQIEHGSEATNDSNNMGYQYLSGKASGSMTFTAPGRPGSYDLRMHDTDSDGKEIASATFKVAGDYKGTLSLAKKTFAPGEAIEASFTASPGLPRDAWVGVIPSAVPHGSEPVNDEHDIQYLYLETKSAGALSFVAPSAAGSYDLRMNSTDSGGVELASVTFTVGGSLSSAAMAQAIKDKGTLSVYGIRFATGQATVEPGSAEALAAIGEMLKANPSMKLRIEGHTDDQGDAAANLELSRKRAESVRTHLVEVLHVDPARLTTKGYGQTRPLGRNDNEAGRAQNRRVELVRE
jgi:outer membrane protein OmpA-like peptidoglycan-associated protein